MQKELENYMFSIIQSLEKGYDITIKATSNGGIKVLSSNVKRLKIDDKK